MSHAPVWSAVKEAAALGLTILAVSLGVSAFLVFVALSARAQSPGDHGYRHQLHHDWYKDLQQPDTGFSCCNGTAEGVEGDCRPTRAYKVGDTWMALVDGVWHPVPKRIVIGSDRNKEPFQAHICASRIQQNGWAMLYCFIEKEGGG